MDKSINEVDFARSVVSGNPVEGSTPEEKAQNALDLYLASKKVIQERNKKLRSENATRWTSD